MIDSNRLLDMLDSNGLIKRGDSRLPSDLNLALRPDKILLENLKLNEIEKGKYKYPNKVYKVPV